MATTQVPTLDINTLSENAPIKINGVVYRIKHPDNLSLVDYKTLEVKLPRLGHLMVKARLTKAESEEAKDLLSDVVDTIVDAPDQVKADLRDAQRVQILDVFTKLRSETPAKPEAKRKTTTRRRTGANSSRR